MSQVVRLFSSFSLLVAQLMCRIDSGNTSETRLDVQNY